MLKAQSEMEAAASPQTTPLAKAMDTTAETGAGREIPIRLALGGAVLALDAKGQWGLGTSRCCRTIDAIFRLVAD